MKKNKNRLSAVRFYILLIDFAGETRENVIHIKKALMQKDGWK